MDSTLKVTELVTPKNKYTIFYYKILVSFGSPYVHAGGEELMEKKKTREMCMLEKVEMWYNFEKE